MHPKSTITMITKNRKTDMVWVELTIVKVIKPIVTSTFLMKLRRRRRRSTRTSRDRRRTRRKTALVVWMKSARYHGAMATRSMMLRGCVT